MKTEREAVLAYLTLIIDNFPTDVSREARTVARAALMAARKQIEMGRHMRLAEEAERNAQA